MSGFVATIGMFDGVHLGHQFVLRHVVEKAHALGLQPLCITFDHSLRREQVLTTLDEKLSLIRQAGINRVEVLQFTPELKMLTAREFMERRLLPMQVRVLLTGYDNRFGHNREEDFDDYVRYGQELGIDVKGLPPAPSVGKGNVICSSYIRQLLLAGDISEATACLGRQYAITGHVVHGEHVGTALGYPTANLQLNNPCQLIPAPGVYAVQVAPITHQPSPCKGMMNIGTRPTFGEHPQTLEVHLLHYHGDLYNQQLSVSFVSRIREERRFDNAEALKEQIEQDAIIAETLLNNQE